MNILELVDFATGFPWVRRLFLRFGANHRVPHAGRC